MSREICMFERMSGTYTEVDGIIYPNIEMDVRELTEAVNVENADVGKYGHLWISYKKHVSEDSCTSMEMWRIREQAKRSAEEVVYEAVVYRYH